MLFVYNRLIIATLIGNFLMIPYKIEIKILAKHPMYRTLGSNGLRRKNVKSWDSDAMWISQDLSDTVMVVCT